MYARVARFTGGDPEAVQQALDSIRQAAEQGPPEGVNGKAFKLMVDRDSGSVVAIGFFETEDDMRQGDRVLDEMSPPEGSMGSRSSVDLCEVAVDVEA